MYATVRTTKPVHRWTGGGRRLRTALLAAAATLSGLLVVAVPPADAGPIDVGWSVTAGAGVVSGSVSDGSASAATFSYSLNPAGFAPRTWDFTAVATNGATSGDPIKVPWTWQGLHAWFGVTAQLQPIVNGVPVNLPNGQTVGTYLVNAGPQNCCNTPSNGFVYGNVATFDAVPAHATYGFRLTGRNGDFNNFLQGTFTLSTRPYIDATIGSDNRQWLGAQTLTPLPADNTGAIEEAGEARWYRFPVVPGQKVTVQMPNPPRDYDLALYGDIGSAFDRLSAGASLAELAAAASGAPPANTQAPDYEKVEKVPTSGDTVDSREFAPRVYAPRVYAPRVYAPRVYAPRVYAPRVYAPRVYAPNSYAPDLQSNDSFREAFTAAQNLALLTVSVNTGADDDESSETVSASTGNTQGYFYVRVQGHDDKVFAKNDPFHLSLSVEGGEDCQGLSDFHGSPEPGPTGATPGAVIVTDTNKLGLVDDPEVDHDPYDVYLDSLKSLATATDGVVVDVSQSARVRDLQVQVQGHPQCPFAVNLVAGAIKDLVDNYRSSDLQYVVIAGGDDVIPFFRYPDTSGIGQENQFSPPMRPDSPAGASLAQDQFLSQDAYGSTTEVTIGGSAIPVPELAVGRLVKTPEEIESTIGHYLGLSNGTLPLQGAGSTLVTGYDFLEDAARRVHTELEGAFPVGTNDTLIEAAGTPHAESWTAEDLRHALFDNYHNVVYLAGHFSANDTLAADFDTEHTFEADELGEQANATKLTDTLVLSAGCHSGYSIVEGEAGLGVNPVDWSQQLARQHALLIGGTGYQYGDSDFLEYSERLYLGITKRLREGPAGQDSPPVAVGRALALAKQDYLASLTTLQGIDQKAVLQATLYGLPMTGVDVPGRSPINTQASQATPSEATSEPGKTLGLWTDELQVNTPLSERQSKHSVEAAALGLPGELTWRNGLDGVSVQPGVPALPKQVVDVTVDDPTLPDLVLRGVGFRGGHYTDTSGLLPLTGSPAVEGATPNTTFDSPAFFPQRLATANYFGALGASARTSLILTPAQYRNDEGADPDQPTNTERAYSDLGFRLFYSGATSLEFGDNQPSLAAAPAITDVQGVLGTDGKVHFRVRATGDPSAGVQQVWVTWTGGPDAAGHGSWSSVDLSQDPFDSTVWSGELDNLPAGQAREALRFVVQASNGAGSVGLDTAEGDGYRVAAAGDVDTSQVDLSPTTPTSASPLGVTATVTDASGAPVSGRKVTFSVVQAGAAVFGFEGLTDAFGTVALGLPSGQALPVGAFTVVANIFDAQGFVTDSDTINVDTASLALTTPSAASPLGVVATVTDFGGVPWAGRTIRWTVKRGGSTLYTYDAQTGADGTVPAIGDTLGVPAGPLTVQAELLNSSGHAISTKSANVFVNGLVLTADPASLVTPAGTSYGVPMKVSVSDARGKVLLAGLPVTFTLPGSATTAGATFPGNASLVTVNTGANGVATSPVPTARTTIGTFNATVSTPGATDLLVPMAAQYAFSTFGSPLSSTGVNTTNTASSTPVKFALLLANGAAIADADAAALVQSQRLQVRSRIGTGAWIVASGLTFSYDTKKDTFQVDVKPSQAGWTRPNTYQVQVRVLPAAGAPQPVDPTYQGVFDLGNRSFTMKVT